MASSIIHLAITNELVKRLSFTDANRLKFGAVVVDAGVGGNKYGNAHMKVNVQDGTKKTYDFDRYREMFGARMLKDDLYLGYYLHLVQDMSSYFLPMDEEPIFFFTKEMSDEFIEEAMEFCVDEVKKIRNGERGIDMLMYAWKRASI